MLDYWLHVLHHQLVLNVFSKNMQNDILTYLPMRFIMGDWQWARVEIDNGLDMKR